MERREQIFVESYSTIKYCNSTFLKIKGTVFRLPVKTQPTKGEKHDYNVCEKCKRSYQVVLDSVQERFAKFPHCCANHSNLAQEEWFHKTDFIDSPDMLANKVIYTKQHIINNIDSENWFAEISNYIDYTISSFGEMPKGFGQPLFLSDYLSFITEALEKDDEMEEYKRKKLLAHFSAPENSPNVVELGDDLELLIKTYESWLEIFPFELSFFKGMKQQFIETLPILKAKPDYNPYTKLSRIELRTQKDLIKFLSRNTKRLLHRIDTTKVYSKASDPEKTKIEMEVILGNHRIKQIKLLSEFFDGESEYIGTVEAWLSNEVTFFSQLRSTVEPLAKRSEAKENATNAEILKEHLAKYGFFNIDSVSSLPAGNAMQLFDVLCAGALPFRIAMIDFLGFVHHLENEHCKTKNQLYKALARIFEVPERTVKGNLLVLNPKSEEKKDRYTSHLHKEQVKKDYEKLK